MTSDRPPETRAGDWIDGLALWTTRGFWAVVDQALFAISNLIVNVLLARWLDPREYGAFVTAYVVLLLVGVAHSSLLMEPMLALGPGKYAGRFKEYFPILLRYQAAFGAVAAATLLLVGAAHHALGQPLLGNTFFGLACAAPFIFLSWLVRRACYVERKPAVAALGGAVYLVIAGVGALVIYNLGLLTSLAAQLLMGVAACTASALIIWKIAFSWALPPTTIDLKLLWREHWNFFRWSGASGLLFFAQGMVFYLVLPFYGGLEATAALRAITNFVMPVLQSDSALITLIAPEMARVRSDTHHFARIVNWSKRLFALEGLMCWLVVAIFRYDLVRYAYGDRYLEYADLLVVLGALPLVSSRVNILGAALRVHRQVRLVFWAAVAAAIASLTVGVASIATLGVYGAVSAMIVADVVRILVMSHFLGRPGAVVAEPDDEHTLVASRQSTPAPPSTSLTAAPRLRVLVCAYACGPGRGSEPGIGWNAVSEIARDHDVWVVTSLENRDRIVAALASAPASLQFIFLDWPGWLGFVKRTRVGFEVQEYCWQIFAYLQARALHRRIGFHLAHHVTVGRYWMPSLFPFLGIPFIWGPVGGGESAPRAFWRGLGFRGALLEAARELARFLGEHDPLLRLAARRTTLGVATTAETSARMRRLQVPRLVVCSNVALTEADIATLGECRPPSANGSIRFVSIGRLVAWKGFHLGLQAFARMRHTPAEYLIVGGGPAQRALKALALRLGVASRVRFLGELPRAEVLQIMQQCDVLVHPSLHESGGFVCAEAMAAGRPVVCLDLGGPGVQVTPETGFKILAREPAQAIRDMASAMDTLAESPALRIAMGQAARTRVRERFNTGAMRKQFQRWYREVTVGSLLPVLSNVPIVAPSINVRSSKGHRMRTSPTVSAVMPTYNKGPWLQQAIDSVLNQTFTDWELIIVDDGSTDDTANVLARCTDPRIKIQTLAKNVGRAGARNITLQHARGRYIAVCDSDDVSAPTRFEQHVAFLDSHPDIGVVSAYIRQLSDNASTLIIFPIHHEAIARRLARGKMGAAHGASMIRAVCFESLGPYCADLRTAEDFELFRRFSLKYRFHTVPLELLHYRNELGAVPLRVWAESMRAHRYALYRSNCYDSGKPVLTFDEFVQSWRTQFAVYTVDSLRFAHFNLRTHVFSSHVLR